MSEVIKIEELPEGGWLEFYSDGRVRAKNAEGQMKKHERNFTPSGAARDIANKGAKMALDQSSEIGELLEYLGLDSPYDYQMAKLMMGGKAGAVAASKELMKGSTQRGNFKSTDATRIKVAPGDICPACRQYVLTDLQLSDDQIGTVFDAIDDTRKQLDAVKAIPSLVEVIETLTKMLTELPDEPDADQVVEELEKLTKWLADLTDKPVQPEKRVWHITDEDSEIEIAIEDTGGLEQ